MHSMVVAIPVLTAAQRERIARAAEAHGYTAQFFESDAEAQDALQEAEIVFGQSAFLAKNAPKLKWLCTPSAGVNQFLAPDVFASPDAILTNSSGAYGVTIAEHIVMMILERLRRQQDYTAIVGRREWIRNLPVTSIHGSRITLLGTGDIGQEAVKRLRGFAPASLVGVSRSGRNPDGLFDRVVSVDHLDELLPETDILIISLPGTQETFHLLYAENLRLLPDGALIVNVGRGTVMDEQALLPELTSGRLQAALDVFETEPLPQDSPLWNCPNLLITPHTAGNMTLPWTVERIVQLFLEDFERYCRGEKLVKQVALARGY